MNNDNRAVVMKFYNTVVNKGDTSALPEIMSGRFVDHFAAPGSPQGIEGFKKFLGMVSTAFPDLQVSVDDLIEEGDKVVVRLTANGTHNGVLMGNIPPTGKHAVWMGIDILKLEQGKITERWSLRDLFSMMRQVGVVK